MAELNSCDKHHMTHKAGSVYFLALIYRGSIRQTKNPTKSRVGGSLWSQRNRLEIPFDGGGCSLALAPEKPQQLGAGPAGESPLTDCPQLTVPTGSSGSLEWLGTLNASLWPLREKDV